MNEVKPSRRTLLQCAAFWASTSALPALRAPAQAPTQSSSISVHGSRFAVATVHPLASEAAMRVFAKGGNAIDAAVAASLMLSVVDGHNSGIGGGGLLLIRQANGNVVAIDGREAAPAAATPEAFVTDGRPNPELSQTGPRASGVPGLLAALDQASRQYGILSWNDALQHAAETAENGFEISKGFASVLAGEAKALAQFESSAAVLLQPNGQPWQAGDRLRQLELATTLRSIASEGVEWFYRGAFAASIAKYMQAHHGLITADDMANYRVELREPIGSTYRSNQVIGFPPPSSGGIHVAQMLGMLSGYPVAEIFTHSQATGLHLLLEVMKRAMADRAHWLGDADFAKVPRGLLDIDYLRDRALSIDLEKTTPVLAHGQPPRADVDLFGRDRHTTHLTTADSQGNVVALTQTVNTSFGSKVIVPGTGVVLNNEMDDFSLAPGVRNAFGLVGAEANAVAPGKRPLSSMSPTIVLDESGNLACTCGAAGGPKIITTTLQTLIQVLDLKLPIDQALAAPRVHHQWSPDEAVCEKRLESEVLEQLKAMGHKVRTVSTAAVAQGIQWTQDRELLASSDPRVASSSLAE